LCRARGLKTDVGQILCHVYPEEYMIWNKKVLTAYLYLGIPGVPKCGVYPSTESDVARINASP